MMLLMVVWGLARAATHASGVGEGHVTLSPVTVRVPGVWSDLLSHRSMPGPLGVSRNTYSTFFKCFISRSYNCLVGLMVSARCVSVLMTPILCSIGC